MMLTDFRLKAASFVEFALGFHSGTVVLWGEIVIDSTLLWGF